VDERRSGAVERKVEVGERRWYVATPREAKVAELAACGDLREHVQYVGTSGVALKFSQRSARIMLAALTSYANGLLDQLGKDQPEKADQLNRLVDELRAQRAQDPKLYTKGRLTITTMRAILPSLSLRVVVATDDVAVFEYLNLDDARDLYHALHDWIGDATGAGDATP
jgi:hypothetical protein